MTGASGTYGGGLLGGDAPAEHARLSSIQSSVDGFTTDVLLRLRPAPGWRCLELGAGAGSIARWLARQCPQGRVTAVDIDTRHLGTDLPPNLDVVAADIGAETFHPGQFDLVHARFVLCHLPERDAILARAVHWLRPGGWLVVTDPYQLPAQTSPFPVVSRLMRAYQDAYAENGADLTWARSVPALLAGSGLVDVDFTGRLGCMGNLGNDRWRPLVAQLAPTLVERGAITTGDLEEFHARLAEPGFIDIPQFTLAAWGRRAG